MSAINFPTSMNLASQKETSITSANASFQRIRSDNATYNDGDIVRLELSTGRKGQYLHGSDSFLSGKVKFEYTKTAGIVRIDSNAYSLFKSVKLYHGSNLIDNVYNANRLYSALYDFQVHQSEKIGDQINMMGMNDAGIILGSHHGAAVASDVFYDFSLTLPCALIGSLSDRALPLGWMGSSSLYLEIELETAGRVLSTQGIIADGERGALGTCSALAIAKYTMSDIYYNAKVTEIGSQYDDILLNAFQGRPIVIPGVSWRGEQKSMNPTTSFSDKFSFQLSSVKMFIWWIVNSATSLGTPVTGTNLVNVNNSISQRQCGKLKEFWLSLNGVNFPSQPIKAGNSSVTNRQYMAETYCHLLRAFNLNSSTERGGIIGYHAYSDSATTIASDSLVKRFIGAIDLDRFDGENDKYMQGTNTMGQNLQFNVTWETAQSENQMLYAYVMYDCAYELVDGLLNVQN
jgi:hypothetical protein